MEGNKKIILDITIRNRGISYTKYLNGMLTGLVIFCLETASYKGLLKDYKGGGVYK